MRPHAIPFIEKNKKLVLLIQSRGRFFESVHEALLVTIEGDAGKNGFLELDGLIGHGDVVELVGHGDIIGEFIDVVRHD